MPFVCTTITTWVEETVVDPVNTWATQQQKQCSKKGWPASWFCWFTTFVVLVVVWITRVIVVPSSTLVCKFVSWIIYYPSQPIVWFIDLVCAKCYATEWLKDFLTDYITFSGKQSAATPGSFVYTFTCKCAKGPVKIEVTATDDYEAAKKAKEACAAAC